MSINWSIGLRPTKLKDVYGLDKLKTFLYKAAKKDEFPEAMLLRGNVGSGKTTVAKIAAQMMVCTNPDADGDPCGECPSCKAIVEETWSRDVLYINTAECENADEFISRVKNATMTAPMRDKRRVLIIDEIQRAFDRNGAKIGQSLLPILEAKRKSKINFIFTMMPISEINDTSQKTRMKAFESRCQVFNYPIFEEMDIVKYMYSLLKKLNLAETLPIEFKTKGLLAIAKCSENSLRKATMMLQQCVETETYSDVEIKKEFGISTVEDFYTTLLRVLDGDKSPELFETLLNVYDYDGMIRLSALAFANAETYRLFGLVNEFNGNKVKADDVVAKELLDLFAQVGEAKDGAKSISEWQKNNTIRQIKPLIEHKNYAKVRDMFAAFYKDNSSYTNKASYILGMTRIIDACREESPRAAVTAAPAATTPSVNAASSGRRIIKE